ncbi:MAG: hypothetical protein LBH28_04195 [Oscillospiraceae bacterium]|nr:hypothetical protein [Oscillospiraceae bacterium]
MRNGQKYCNNKKQIWWQVLEKNRGEYLLVEIKAESGANIKPIVYINVDKWGEVVINRLADLIVGGGNGGY